MIKVRTFISGFLKNNSYLLWDKQYPDKCSLIDPSESFEQITKYLDNNKLSLNKVFLTHGHFDHVVDVPKWQGNDIKVYIHQNELPNLDSILTKQSLAKRGLKPIIVDSFIKDEDIYMIGDSSLKVYFTPGHSAGSCSFTIDGCLFSGDTLFKDSYGRTDFFDGNFSDIKKSIKRLFLLPGEYDIFPGHYEQTLLSYERINNPIRYDF